MITRKSYTKEFKQQGVELAQRSGNMSATARDLGLRLSVLRRWKKEFEHAGQQAFVSKGHSQNAQLEQLKKENQRLKETVEILKKAVGIFTNRS